MRCLIHYSSNPPACACCGTATLQFLGLDHINGGGNKHRTALKKAGFTTELWLRKNNFPAGFRVLCHNCNLSRGYYGNCPHEVQKVA
jgi:hypothetical protein